MYWSDFIADLVGSFVNAFLITRLVRYLLKKKMGEDVRIATYTFSISAIFYMMFNYFVFRDFSAIFVYILFASLLYAYDLYTERELLSIGGVENQIK